MAKKATYETPSQRLMRELKGKVHFGKLQEGIGKWPTNAELKKMGIGSLAGKTLREKFRIIKEKGFYDE